MLEQGEQESAVEVVELRHTGRSVHRARTVPELAAMAAAGETDRAVAAASLPELVRGDEDVKPAAVERYRAAPAAR